MTVLETRALGETGMEITRVGFGAWAAGGGGWSFGWGPQDDAASIAAIRHSVELGVNWIDTAAAYGLGHSEEVVAAALEGFAPADRPLVFTKCGTILDPRDPMAPPRRVGDPASVRREVEASLRRLRVDRIDLFQMHWPAEDGTPLEAYWEVFLELRDEGVIAAAGLSNHGVALLESAEALGHVDSVQPPYSLIKRRAGADVIPWCAAHGTGVVVYSPMQSGLLSGTFSAARVATLAADDWRRRSPEFSGEVLERNLALAEALRPIAARYGTSVGTVAIAWTLATPGVSGAIVGAREPSQVDGWIAAAGLTLGNDDLAEIATAVERVGAGEGPSRP
ncbi:MAG: aldo/keto reductase [Acidimicrobiales bacterium]|jgi:aryl-alcohol dehydrogenase-like predicted oxidoreductase